MSLANQKTLRIVLYEGEGSEAFSAEDRFATLTSLLEQGYSVTRSGGRGNVAKPDASSVLVLGKFGGRAPQAEDAAGEVSLDFQDVTGLDSTAITAEVEKARNRHSAVKQGEWKPWFPVIDFDRCTNCLQCLSFCLFGVYGVDEEKRIQVQNNDNCKTNCPACSRVCPEAAIMFPKYKAGPINGDSVSAADLQREKMKIDISALLGGDIYSMLKTRSERAKSRFSKERDSDKALAERMKCLTKLAQSGDIPPEVLMSLPSPEEIQRKAAEAAARVEAARAGTPAA
jgi:Pyruvate/2-oxoacid:ferredoxin oxidoreductase delta subunit